MTTSNSRACTRLRVWGHDLDPKDLTSQQMRYLSTLPESLPDVTWVWQEMNRVWREVGLDNTRSLKDQTEQVSRFYSHPIWLVNGLFTAADGQSARHRKAIALHLTTLNAATVADYGGGFGELALTIARHNPDIRVTVVEPYPTQVGLSRLAGVAQIDVQPDLSRGPYDVVLAQDVLEHVDDPVALAHDLARSVRRGGHLVVANCFHPMIDCHLPQTFHLRYTFDHVMRCMGLVSCGKVPDAPNARVFRVGQTPSLAKARAAERISSAGLGQALNVIGDSFWRLQQAMARHP